MSEAAAIRKRVLYSGRVQGVFFRATAEEISRGFAVSGYVCNLPDGRVELEAQGSPAAVAMFLDTLEAHFHENISGREVSETPVQPNERDFQIRRS